MTTPYPHLSHPKYRPDIDGLRAVAVLAVVAFHAFPSYVKGGFIGVDVFFVISGYLISTIIFENLDRGTFSFTEFYARRIKRIFPALLLVLVASYIFGWFALLADEYKQLGKHMAAGAGFVSNIVQWGEAGYFDNSAETKPLLHLWSLGIEEQFYIIWPLVLWFSWKRKFNLLTLTVVVALVSFVLNVKGVKQDSVATFYSPQTRFWELFSGTILAWFALYKKNVYASIKLKIDGWVTKVWYRENVEVDERTLSNVFSFFGCLLLAYGFGGISKTLSFPGMWAVVPVLGSVLIILAGPKAWINRKILSTKVLVWFGLISFPLYLWHWPLLSFARIVEGAVPSRDVRVAAVALSIVLAWLTYKLIEHPIRFGKHGKAKVIVLVVLMSIVGYVGYNAYERNGLEFRQIHKSYSSFVDSISSRSARESECFDIPYAYKKPSGWFCELGEKSKPTKIFAYGDSHALSLVPALEKFSKTNNVNIQFTGASGCPSLLGIQSMRGNAGIEKHNCELLNERIFNHVKHSGVSSVVLISRWTYYLESQLITRDISKTVDKYSSAKDLLWAIENTVSRYNSIGIKVILVEDNPQQLHSPKEILRRGSAYEANYNNFAVSYDEHIRNQELVNSVLRSQNAYRVDFNDVLCDTNLCPLVRNSRFLYFDNDHLSIDGAYAAFPKLSEVLSRVK